MLESASRNVLWLLIFQVFVLTFRYLIFSTKTQNSPLLQAAGPTHDLRVHELISITSVL